MPTSLVFSRFIQLIKAIEQLPIPAELFNRYRMQYDWILTQLCVTSFRGQQLMVSDFIACSILGSQPTANKRLQELIKYGLIEPKEGDDRRQKILVLTQIGSSYLEACSEAMTKAVTEQVIS